MNKGRESEISQPPVGLSASSEDGSCMPSLAELMSTTSRSTGLPFIRNTRGLVHTHLDPHSVIRDRVKS